MNYRNLLSGSDRTGYAVCSCTTVCRYASLGGSKLPFAVINAIVRVVDRERIGASPAAHMVARLSLHEGASNLDPDTAVIANVA